MVSAAMATQDQIGCARSNAVLPSANANPPTIKSVLQNEQFPSGDDYSLKVRKPYTITKQRERWTEEEHKKFLEALKLYGRAWRRIEEHVGTKSAVQIRSHAQKFFSKVFRESDATAVKPLEIPPPRPKRKPMHPYPRKVVPLVKTGTPLPEQASSESPTFSASEQENQSPTSVLSAVGSDTLGSKDSNTRNGSLSSVSSASGVNHGGFVLFESNPSTDENESLLPAQGTTCSSPDEEIPMKLELFTEENAVVNGSADTASTQSLKLFGKTLFVADPQKPSSPTTTGTCKSLSPEMNDWRPVQTSLWNTLGNPECTWSSLAQGSPAKLYYMQVLNENSDSPETGSNPSLPCWPFYGGMLPLHIPLPSKAFSESGENQERETQKEGSWTGSNTGSANVGNDGDKNLDVETESHSVSFDEEKREQKPKLPFTLNLKSALGRRAKLDNCMRGFVPYKRCVLKRDNTQSSSVTGEERAEQRIRLCL